MPDVESIEQACFSALRRCSRRSLRHSLHSAAQEVALAVAADGRVVGALVLHMHPHTVRIYSLAVLPAFQGCGVGRLLMAHAAMRAARGGRHRMSLEADRRDARLLRWYAGFGFKTAGVLADYYAPGCDAVRMWRALPAAKQKAGQRGGA